MGAIVDVNIVVLSIATAVAALLASLQTLHVFFLASRKGLRQRKVILAYESSLVFYLILIAGIANSTAFGWREPVLHLYPLAIPIGPLLWVNVVVGMVGVYLFQRLRYPYVPADIIAILIFSPLSTGLNGSWVAILALLGLAYFLFRVSSTLVLDAIRLRSEVTRFSVTEAIMAAPEGVLIADNSGRIILMNDAMRHCMAGLGFPADLSDSRGLWAALQRKATLEPTALLAEGVVLSLADQSTKLFTVDAVRLRGRDCQRILAVDVTEAEDLNRDVERVNSLLECAAEELRIAMENVVEIAHNDALLSAHSRVHDVIGQRLSILHRYLEDGDITDTSLNQMRSILGEIRDGLRNTAEIDGLAELNAIVEAFKLVQVRLSVDGQWPMDPSLEEVFIQVVREASTNAVRHGQARFIAVSITREVYGVKLMVTNDGSTQMPIDESSWGEGLKGMRNAVESLGGRFTVQSTSPFTVSAMFLQQGAGLAMEEAKGTKL